MVKNKQGAIQSAEDDNCRNLLGPEGKQLARREKVYNDQDVRLFNIGPGQIIGFNDVIDQRRYSSFVKCISSSGTVYVIKSEEFNVKMRKDSRTWNFLLKEARDRDQ